MTMRNLFSVSYSIVCCRTFIPSRIQQRQATSSVKTNYHKKKKKLPFPIKGEIIFGIHPIELALSARRRKLFTLFVKNTPDQETGNQSFINVSLSAEGLVERKEFVNKQMLDRLSEDKPHQGICLDASPLIVPELDFQNYVNKRKEDMNNNFPVWLLPYRVKDVHNLGAVLRSCHFLGVEHVVLPTIHTCSLTPMVSKASSGAMEVMNISQVRNDESIIKFIKQWKDFGGRVIGASLDEENISIPIDQYHVRHPTLLIIGNEEKGMKFKISSLCDNHVCVHPADSVHPLVDSLNVSVATGIILHHLTKKKQL
ncbi:21S rRNA (GM2251-2'-O)-methyltransferase [Mytilus galloprovincialis]|uniref:rRNA methyltransferase 1, mitochondrial n=1 Tax=Mytilus galloprovincialis TaxID=29158 RepID=A0A8B6CTB4_MYTGA|nr:21S rRNA (GM2251-2'-O)-methyltransferase [Mytilus galloprovincialis]